MKRTNKSSVWIENQSVSRNSRVRSIGMPNNTSFLCFVVAFCYWNSALLRLTIFISLETLIHYNAVNNLLCIFIKVVYTWFLFRECYFLLATQYKTVVERKEHINQLTSSLIKLFLLVPSSYNKAVNYELLRNFRCKKFSLIFERNKWRNRKEGLYCGFYSSRNKLLKKTQ